MNPNDFNVRILAHHEPAEIKAMMLRVGSEQAGIARMVPKAEFLVIKVHGLPSPAAIIIKECMLSAGGDAAIHRDCITNRVAHSDVLLMGNAKMYTELIAGLRRQPFSLPKLADELELSIARFKATAPSTPEIDRLPERLRGFYSAMRERTVIMGILNVTPDSFSDGGLYRDVSAAIGHGLQMVKDGADIIDVGGESTRPGATPVSIEEEMARVVPVVEELAKRSNVPISIDTYKPEVAEAALNAGADIINDITALQSMRMRTLAAQRRVPVVIMHMQGTPQNMQDNPTYEDVISDILQFMRERIKEAVTAGLPREYLIVDPGIGFGKTVEHNLEIIRGLRDFRTLGLPILVGPSRKSFIGQLLGGVPPAERLEGTAAAVALCIANGANVVRVHDVAQMVRVSCVARAISG